MGTRGRTRTRQSPLNLPSISVCACRYGSHENTWEDEDSILDDDLIDAYKRSKRARTTK